MLSPVISKSIYRFNERQCFLKPLLQSLRGYARTLEKILEEGVMKGMFTKENFNSFFPNDSFNKIVDSLMGLNSIENLKKIY